MQSSKIFFLVKVLGYCVFPFLCWGSSLSSCQVSLSSSQEKQWRTLLYKIRCPTCEGQTVAESSAPLAQKIQCFLARGIQEGKSSEELLSTLEERFGPDIKEVDAIKPCNILLWGFPIFFLGWIIFFISRKIRKMVKVS